MLLKSSTVQLDMIDQVISKVETINESERKLSLQNEQLQFQINQMKQMLDSQNMAMQTFMKLFPVSNDKA